MTAAVVQDLTDVEAGALVECERVIERGLKTFVEVGEALARIRDGRLYRSEYTTFEAYCDERWALSRPRAYQLISAAEVVSTTVDSGLPAPANEAQARELARVPEEQRAEVWREARDRAAGRPTAATIREVVRERQAPAPAVSTPDLDVMLRYSKVAGWIVGTPGGAPWATAGVDISELSVLAAQLWAAEETQTAHQREVIRWVESTDRAGAWVAVLADDAPPSTAKTAAGASEPAPADGAASSTPAAPASAPASGEPAGAEVTPKSPARPDHEAIPVSGASAVATTGGSDRTAAEVSGTRPADVAASTDGLRATASAAVPAGAGAAAAGAPIAFPAAGAPVTPCEPYDLLAAAFSYEEAAPGCKHRGERACARCLAEVAVHVLRDYLLDELADAERYEGWYRANAEQLDEVDPDMSHAAVVAHYLVDVVLPNRPESDGDGAR